MKSNKKQNQAAKKNSGLLLAAAVIVVLCLAVTVITKQKGKTAASNDNPSSAARTSGEEIGEAAAVSQDESLIIPVSDVTAEASFFPVEVDGTRMEIIVVKDSSGNIRTAFNTCQICYGSGRGYYVQQGNVLVCQNCGNRFTVDQVGIESGGCNPWPIFEDDRTITGDSIEISYDFLAESKDIFANWKLSY